MSERKAVTSDEARAIQRNLSHEFFRIAKEMTEHVEQKQQWLIVARAVNYLFAKFYRPALEFSSSLLTKQKDADDPK